MGLFSRDKSPLRDPAPTQYLPQYTAEASYSSTPRYQTRFASMSIHQEDEVRFLHFPDAVVNLCRATASTWHKGMKGEKEYGGSIEFKFHGHPWRGGNEESLEAARLMNGFLRTLHSQGWILALSTDVTKKMYDKDTLLFRHQSPLPAESDWCSIVFSKTDRLRLVDGKSCVEMWGAGLGDLQTDAHVQFRPRLRARLSPR
ncbi:hypothetical protein BS50DRAFT_570199 [Corynespora cassiicola Philippines]|uniref:Uncharacterized protein n=1 Tax=Corynespora cassiicola Philippines TaxID=1448308 RepID=A0A2T2NZ23_CORCC|nr:hypothetical protein BS50DRAFT_570199 [Corynespora cassiicola Philippines]